MAQTISHEAQAPVKKNPGNADDAPSKARLATLLACSYEQMEDIQDQLAELSEKINPEPAPLPPTIDPNILFTGMQLKEEEQAVVDAGNALGAAVEEFKRAARRVRSQLAGGRNARAWGKLTGWLDEEAKLRVEAVDNAIRALLWHTRLVAALVTFAQADDLPENMGEEAGNE